MAGTGDVLGIRTDLDRCFMIVIARSYGQLGNRLFLYAHMIAAARQHNTIVANPCFAEYAHLFCNTQNDLWCRYPAVSSERAPSLVQRKWLSKSVYLAARALSISGCNSYPMNIIRLRGDEACDLDGDAFASLAAQRRHLLAQGWLFRSEKLLNEHAVAIRSHFRILPKYQAAVDGAITQIRAKADVVVGVHIRHGDYKTFLDGKYFFTVEQYAAMMHQVADQFPGQRVAFLVCSNAKMCPDDFAGLNVCYGSGHIIEDLYSFAQCDLLIGPPSTYTGWASFYGSVPICEIESADQRIDAQMIMSGGFDEDRCTAHTPLVAAVA